MNNTVQTLNVLRRDIFCFHQQKQIIHVSISMAHPKINLVQVPVFIKHVSAQLFLIERTDHLPLPHSAFQYADLITRRIVIHELES